MTAAGPAVRVELLSLAVDGEQIRYDVILSAPATGADLPDELALRLAGPDARKPGAVLHSTSWRAVHGGVVLTYALFPSWAEGCSAVLPHHVVTGPDAVHPAPAQVEPGHLAAHAVRHLADLASGRDPHITRAADHHPEQWSVLRAHARRVHVDHDLAAGTASTARPVVRSALPGDPPPAGLSSFVEACAAADGHPPFEEHTMLTLDGAHQLPHARVELSGKEGLLGCAVLSEGLAGWSVEAAVHPLHRGRGHGASLLGAAAGHVASHGGGAVSTWVHGPSDAAQALGSRWGARTDRRLLVLSRSLDDLAPASACPDGVRVRILDTDSESDREGWLRLSNAAFDGHPENGAWSRQGLDWRMNAAWTDATRFPVAEDEHGLAAGVWTKVEPGATTGELHVVATHPRAQGRGLGRLVVDRALHALRDSGCLRAELYVDADNTSALGLYLSSGFRPGVEHHRLTVDIAPADLTEVSHATRRGLPAP